MVDISKELQEENYFEAAKAICHELLKAYRAFKLYPPSNPIPFQSLQSLTSSLEAFLLHEGEFPLSVRTEGLFFLGQALGEDTKSFATELRLRGVVGLSFFPGVSLKDLTTFLEALILDPDEVRAKGGIATILWGKEVTSIAVREGGTKLVEISEKIETGELEGEEEAFEEILIKKPSDLLPTERRVLLRFLEQPKVLSQFLGSFFQSLDWADQEATEKYLSRFLEALGKTAEIITGEFSERAPHLFRNLGEAVLSLEADVKRALFGRHLLNSGSAQPLLRAFAELSPEELAEALSLALKGEEVQNFLNLIEESDLPGEFKEEIEKIFGKGEETLVEKSLYLESSPAEHQELVEKISLFENALTEEESEFIRSVQDTFSDRTISRHSTSVLVDLLSMATSQESFRSVVSRLVEAASLSIRKGHFEEARFILRALRKKHTSEGSVDEYQIAEKALKKLSSTREVSGIIDSMADFSLESQEYEEVISYLALLDREAVVRSLIELLGREEQMSRRKLLVNLLVRLGKYQVETLGSYVEDPRWYLVRNVVKVLGQLEEPEKAFPYIVKALEHHDNRVKVNAIKVLSGFRTPEAGSLIGQMLGNEDLKVREVAARYLAKCGEMAVLPLLDYLEKGSWFGDDFSVRLTAIESLGLIGSQKAKPLLEKAKSVKSFWQSAKANQLRQQAREALKQIEQSGE